VRGGRAAPGRVRSWGDGRDLSPVGWQLQKRSARLFSGGSSYFSVGNRRLWQLAEAHAGLLVACGKRRGLEVQPTWMAVVGRRQPSHCPREQPNRCSANYKMLLRRMKITWLSIQRTDNGLFSSQNTGKKVC